MTQNLIEKFNLAPHPEGGYFRRTYTASQKLGAVEKERSVGSAIYYYLDSDDFSAWHRLNSDEMWHYYAGSGLTVHVISPEGELTHIRIGDPTQGEDEIPQFVVPAGHWFAAEVGCDNTYGFVGCTLFPEYDEASFELADREKLSAKFPQHKDIIHRLTREN